MDLTPLYELRERLRAGAIAGAALAADDFRLARALEHMIFAVHLFISATVLQRQPDNM